jgi:DNA-binding transcriptional MocR family regulator
VSNTRRVLSISNSWQIGRCCCRCRCRLLPQPPPSLQLRHRLGSHRPYHSTRSSMASASVPTINLARGQPATEHLPRQLLIEASNRTLAEADTEQLLQYGDEQGNRRFLDALAMFTNDMLQRQNPDAHVPSVLPSHLFATWGASHSVSLACTLYSKPNDIVFVEVSTRLSFPCIDRSTDRCSAVQCWLMVDG